MVVHMCTTSPGRVPEFQGDPGQEEASTWLLTHHGSECGGLWCTFHPAFPLSSSPQYEVHRGCDKSCYVHFPSKFSQEQLCCPFLPTNADFYRINWTEPSYSYFLFYNAGARPANPQLPFLSKIYSALHIRACFCPPITFPSCPIPTLPSLDVSSIDCARASSHGHRYRRGTAKVVAACRSKVD